MIGGGNRTALRKPGVDGGNKFGSRPMPKRLAGTCPSTKPFNSLLNQSFPLLKNDNKRAIIIIIMIVYERLI
jgi:hypothetical protein